MQIPACEMLSNPTLTPSSYENTPRRRKLRKGTRSCWECRQRKVKCTFASEEDSVCITCRRRGTPCASQATLGRPHTGNNPVYTQLTAASQAADNVGSRGDTELPDDTESSPQSICFPISPTPSSSLQGNSVESLANNRHDRQFGQTPILLTTPELPPTPASNYDAVTKPSTNSKIIQALLRSLPLRGDIELLLVKVNRISMLRYLSYYKTRTSSDQGMLGVQISVASLLYPDTHPVLLARQMLLLAVALQYLSPNEVIPGLTRHHHQIMEEIAESAITMVTTNDVLLGTLEGLENIILEGNYHVNNGNIRRSWITMRRAVMAAQLLGLHRPGHYRFKVINDQNDLVPELMWANILTMERGQSLLLGLPTSTAGMNCDCQVSIHGLQQVRNLSMLTMKSTAQILERNQIHPSQQALAMTRQIDRDLVKITEQMPSTFWRPPMFTDLEKDSADAFGEAARNSDLVYYYTLVNQLHLPYMFCPSNKPQMVYSRAACVNASREVLHREIAVRSFNAVTACCRIGDFMALIAGMTLMLAHIVSHCHRDNDNMLIHQRMSDRATVEQALECMNSMSELREDVLTAKCATLLKDLLAVEADAAQGQIHRNVLIMQVPYVGAIKISPEGISSNVPSRMTQDRDLPEGVTIGGIGSVYLDNSALPETVFEIAASQPPTTNPISATSSQEHAKHTAQVSSDGQSKQQDDFFPDAAASLDDWVFQGIDTAFFDVLMRGAENEQPYGADAEVWDM